MSEPLTIIITEKKGRPLKIEVLNAKGTECTEATQALNKLGSVESVEYKPEYQSGSMSSNINLGI